MLFGTRNKSSSVWVATIIFLLGAYALPVFGEEEKTIDEYISDATPYLHHSCESAWGASGQNAEEYVAIINRFVAIVFINHDFDIQRIADAPEADQEELRVLFYDEIGERCAADSQKLLAGVVENSLVHAFDVMKGRGG
jgi:hypothetical protein